MWSNRPPSEQIEAAKYWDAVIADSIFQHSLFPHFRYSAGGQGKLPSLSGFTDAGLGNEHDSCIPKERSVFEWRLLAAGDLRMLSFGHTSRAWHIMWEQLQLAAQRRKVHQRSFVQVGSTRGWLHRGRDQQ